MDQYFLDSVKSNFIKQIQELDEQEKYFLIEDQIGQAVGDEMDMISNALESDFILKLHNRNKFLRKKLFYALSKVEDGTYGSCEDCNQKISMGRLLARPTATLCIQCKEGQEKEESMIHTKGIVTALWATKPTGAMNTEAAGATLKAINRGEI